MTAQYEAFASHCRSLHDPTTEPHVAKGRWWREGIISQTGYNHVMPVNGNSCTNGGAITGGAWSAESYHPGGANVGFVDGHVEFVSETIAPATWRALGGRAGGEVIATP